MGYELAVGAALVIYLFGISIRDVKYREISNSAPVILIMASPFLTVIPFSDRVIGLIAVFIPLLLVNLLTNGFGMGDVKLCAAFGFMLGAVPEYIAVILALFSAVIVGKISGKKTLPLAPFICGASMAILFCELAL